jgi:hypothetical protein
VIVCYARGAGLGHLTRLRAYLHTIGHRAPVTILTTSPHATGPRVTAPHTVLTPPPDLRAFLWEVGAAEFVVDAFPAGLDGELDASVVPPGVRVTHLARLLRWSAYAECLPERPLRFDRTWLVEPVTHGDYLVSVSAHVAPLRLAEPPAAGGPGPGGWLVVHTGPDEETLELVSYARETARLEGIRAALTLVSPSRPAGLPPEVTHLDVYPAWPLFAGAERIITAAGCNAVRQVAPWRERHRMVPFPRRYDDQFARAARYATEPTGA